MPAAKAHNWTFRSRFPANALGWRSDVPIKRIKEAVAEIKAAARKDKILGAEGAVILLEKVSGALEQVDSSSGAIGGRNIVEIGLYVANILVSFLALGALVGAAHLAVPKTRAQTMEYSQTIDRPTADWNELFIVYHPDDIAHRRDNPRTWLYESFAYGAEARNGGILAFKGYELKPVIRMRLTTGALSEREQGRKRASWTFRYRVRHGKVFVSSEAWLSFLDKLGQDLIAAPLPEHGFELPNGSYAVTVHAIEWDAEPGALSPYGTEPTDNALPAYVIAFKPVEDLESVETSPTPIGLPYQPGSPPHRMPSSLASWNYEQLPLKLGAERLAVVSIAPDAPFAHYMPLYAGSFSSLSGSLVAAVELREGALALVSQGAARFSYFDEPVADRPPAILLLAGARLARIRSLKQVQEQRYAEVELVSRPPSTVPASEIATLKDEIEALAQRSEAFRLRLLEGNTAHRVPPTSSENREPDPIRAALAKRDGTFRAGFYELDRVQSFASAEALTTWLIYMLDLPIQFGLELLARSDADRIPELRKELASR